MYRSSPNHTLRGLIIEPIGGLLWCDVVTMVVYDIVRVHVERLRSAGPAVANRREIAGAGKVLMPAILPDAFRKMIIVLCAYSNEVEIPR